MIENSCEKLREGFALSSCAKAHSFDRNQILCHCVGMKQLDDSVVEGLV